MNKLNQLTKAQMRLIVGGEELNKCTDTSTDWCGHTTDNQIHQCGITKNEAMYWDKYCCASCPTWPGGNA